MREKDKSILDFIQRQKLCTPQLTKLANRVKLPLSTVKDRISSLEKEGVITGYVPEINPEKVGEEVLVFVFANVQDLEHPEKVCEKIAKYNFVQGMYFLVGDKDILIKVRARSISDYREKMKLLRKYIVGGGGIVVSKVFKDTLYVDVG